MAGFFGQLVGLFILNLFFSPIAYGLLEGRCTKRLVLNCFLWTLGIIPGAIHGFFKLTEALKDSFDTAE
jgi:uncharacterized membrane protein YqaE (UPF0057 family)